MVKRSKIKLAFSWLIAFVLIFSPLVSTFMPIAAAATSGDFEVSVSYDANGGSGEMKPLTVACMEYITLPENGFIAPEGCTFKTWDIGGTEYAPNEEVQIRSDTVVKAVWKDVSEVSEGSGLPASSEMSNSESASSEKPAPGEAEKAGLDDNPDHLLAPDDSPYGGEIDYGIFPVMSFGGVRMMRSMNTMAANNSPVIGTDHPTQPGEVMLFKEAKPIAGIVNTWEVTLRIEGKDTRETSDVVLVIDRSGSMNDQGRMAAAQQAANAFVDELLPSDTTRIAVVSFSGDVTTNQGLTNDATTLKSAINGLNANGGTFTQAGVKQAEALLANSTADHKHIVLLSDGVPTYSYEIPNSTVRRDGYVHDGSDYVTGTGYASSAYGTSRVGNGSSIYSYIEWYLLERAYYNHGNSAIAEAGFAGVAGYNVYTIGLQTGGTGSDVLSRMKQNDGTFTEVSDVSQLDPVFQAIAGQIGAAVKEAAVTDPMGAGFQIPAANVSGIITVPASPPATYNATTKSISWNPGTLTTPIEPGSDIKYAELKYTIEINDDILAQTPDVNGEYPTNGSAQIQYTDAGGNQQTGTFPVPKVNPVLYKVVKELQDKDGTVITDDRSFTVQVTGPGAGGAGTVRSFTLNTNTESSTKLMTDLRYASTYTFEETGNLSDYDVSYYVDGVAVSGADRKFTITDGNTADVEVKVVNKEKPGTLTITKVLDQSVVSAKSGTRAAVSFSFSVTGPNSYNRTFDLPDNGSWTKTLTNLVKGTYTVTEITTGYTTSVQVNENPSVSGNSADVTIDIGALNQTVTVTNKQTENMSVTATKTWVNAPTDKPDIWFQLIRINSDNSETKIGSPKAVISNTVSWNQTDVGLGESLLRYDENGNEYIYKVQEVDADGNDFVPGGFSKIEDGLNVKNSFYETNPADITSLRFEKTWAGVPEGMTPPDITVQVMANNEVYATATLRYPDTVVEWKNLPLHDADGNLITYTINELGINDFDEGTPVYTESVIENVYCEPSQNQTDWSLQNPAFIITRLTKNGPFVVWTLNHIPQAERVAMLQNVIAASQPDNFKQPLKDLGQYLDGGGDYFVWLEGANVSRDILPNDQSAGQITINITFNTDGTVNASTIHYQGENTWTHFAVGGYSSKLAKITNTYNQETIDIPVTKTWEDNNDQDGMRPESITIRLLKNGTEIASKTVTEADGWAWSFTDLPKYEAGELITYTITEDTVSEYSSAVSGYNVTNTHTPGKTSVQVTKAWADGNNQDGVRPESVTIKLLADGVDTGKTLVLTATNNWTDTFTDLDEYKAGTKIVYTIEELTLGSGYTSVITGDAATGFEVTNTKTPEVVDVSGTKTWEDNNDQDGMRPESITIRLLKNGTEIASKTVTEADGWAWSFTDLPKYEAGELITYTITEDTVSEYSSEVSGYNVTNTHTPGKTSVQVTKAWADGNNQDGVRPESVTIKLLADGEDTGKTLVLTATNNWTDTFTDLDEYKAGTKIVYTIEELTLGSGYTSVITGDAATGFEVTNTKTPEVVDVSGTKTWEDNNDQDGMRPDSITIRLLKNGTEIASKTVTEADGWAWSFTDLPKYEAGELITYTITEDTVSEYSSAVSGYNVTNTYTPGKTSVQVTKAWADGNNQDGVRPESVTIKLLADGVDTGKTLVLTATNNWTDTFTDLDEYKAGTKIVYTIEELTLGSGYTSVITGDAATGFEVTNTKTPEVVDVSGTKTWEDNNDQDGMRPESITIRLLKNGTEIASKTVTEADGWAWSFTDLPKYEAGELITYTITEDTVSEYSSAVSGYNVTNTHTPGKTSVQVTKAWADGNNQDGVRPESVTIKLLADGVDTGKTLVLTATNNWTDTFTDLDEYKAGTKIVYTIEELTLGSGYTSVITGDAATGFEVTNTKTPEVVDVSGTKTWEDNNDQDGMRPESITIRLLKNGTEIASKTVTEADGWAWSFTDLPKYEAGELITYTITEDTVSEYSSAVSGYNVTNTYTPGKTSVQVTKAWADGNNQDGVRPESVTIKLLADGVDTGKTLVLTATNNWTDTFTDLDEYKAGTKIVYTIEELTLGSGYTSVITGDAATGFEVTNTKTPEVVDVSGTKTWEDNNDQDGMRPESITIRLLKNGTEIASKTVTEADGWAWSFTDLPKYEAGELITYTITEDTVSEYSSAVSGYNVTNTYTPGKTSVQVTKAWADGNNQDGVRPESVTIKLLADGVDTGKTLVLTATNNWTDTFTDLDEYKAGTKIVYTIEELTLGSGYTSVITGDAATGFEVTNTKTPEVPIVPPEPKDPEDPVPLIPRTGDDGGIYPWVGVMLFSIAGLLLSVRKKLKADRD